MSESEQVMPVILEDLRDDLVQISGFSHSERLDFINFVCIIYIMVTIVIMLLKPVSIRNHILYHLYRT